MMPQCKQSGFTLLEILIAMAIFTLIGLASTNLLSTVIDSNELSNERFDKLQQLQRAMMLIERDVLQAVARPVRINGEVTEQVIHGGEDVNESEADGLALVHAGWHNPQHRLPRSTLQAVGYRLRENNLERLYGNYVDNVVGFEPKTKVILQQVDDFQVQFLAPNQSTSSNAGASSSKRWSDSFQGTLLPQAIAIEIDSQVFGLIRREFKLAGNKQ